MSQVPHVCSRRNPVARGFHGISQGLGGVHRYGAVLTCGSLRRAAYSQDRFVTDRIDRVDRDRLGASRLKGVRPEHCCYSGDVTAGSLISGLLSRSHVRSGPDHTLVLASAACGEVCPWSVTLGLALECGVDLRCGSQDHASCRGGRCASLPCVSSLSLMTLEGRADLGPDLRGSHSLCPSRTRAGRCGVALILARVLRNSMTLVRSLFARVPCTVFRAPG